ncbi:hypothetical protein ACIBH1_23175 [Nonomuraea sp. NPDC050663]|uniref:hypothetical protein n=1 Tax=Nonomuraea sp. NPDC050663 TaxID=3364370 RepID=UPI0037A34947
MRTIGVLGLVMLAAVMAAMLAIMLAGCAAGEGWRGQPLRPVSGEEYELLDQAEKRLTGRCMAEEGFVLAAVPYRRDFPYGVTDERWAAARGYGPPGDDVNGRYLRSLTPQRRSLALTLLHGRDPEGLAAPMPSGGVLTASDTGCVAWAQDELYGDVRAWYRARNVAVALDLQIRQRVTADPAYRAALGRWSACMEAAGHPLAAPAQEGPPARALAEARCAASTSYGATVQRLHARLLAAAPALFRTEADNKVRLELAALPRARQIMREAR